MDVGKRPSNIPALTLAEPFLVTGFDDAPEGVRAALAGALARKGCGYIGRRPPARVSSNGNTTDQVAWLQLLQDSDSPDAKANGLIYVCGSEFSRIPEQRPDSDQLLGMVVNARTLTQAIPFALNRQMDVLMLDGTPDITDPGAELKAPADLAILRDAIALLRQLGKEEEIALISYGGMRSGTDVAKALAINCNAAVFGLAAGLAMGAEIDHSTNKRLYRWKLNFRAPIWIFMLIFVIALLFGNFVEQGYSEVVNQTGASYLYPTP